MKGRSRSPWSILSSGNNTGILSSGNNTGILSSGNNTGILSSGNDSGILSSGNNTGFAGMMRLGKGLLNRATKALSFLGGGGLFSAIGSLLSGVVGAGRTNRSEEPIAMGGGKGAADWSRGPSRFLDNKGPERTNREDSDRPSRSERREERRSERREERRSERREERRSDRKDDRRQRREEKRDERTAARDDRREDRAAKSDEEAVAKESAAVELAEELQGDESSEAKVEKLVQVVSDADSPVAEAEVATAEVEPSDKQENGEDLKSASTGGLLPAWDD